MENKRRQKVLRRQSEFELLKKTGKRNYFHPWLVVNILPNCKGYIRYGFTISRKVGGAVLRNKLKRWGREFFRTQLSETNAAGYDINVIFKPINPEFFKGLSHSEFIKGLSYCLRNYK